MYNKIVLEGTIQEYEYITQDDDTILVNGTILSQENGDENNWCILYFHISGNLAKIYHKRLFKDTKVLLEGQLKYKRWKEPCGNLRARYILNVQNLKLFDKEHQNNFSILYDMKNNSFKINKKNK